MLKDAWGSFYSAYTPVFNSRHEVAGIIGVDFSAEWYNRQLAILYRTTIIVAVLSLLVGGGIVYVIIARNRKKIDSLRGQLDELASTLMHEMGKDLGEESEKPAERKFRNGAGSIDDLEKQIHSMQTELKTQIAQVHGQAYTDGLTGVKSKQAYLDAQKSLDEKLNRGTLPEFAIAVCDVNGLKKINDTQGHQAGDEYICKACKMICDIFSHSPVYRVGGDEFVVVLSGKDYENRNPLMHELHRCSVAHILTQEAIVSGGIGCRKGGDTFLLYCPHREDYDALIGKFLEDLFVEKETENKVSLRFGICAFAEQEENMEERFAKAADAADKMKGREEIIGYAE